MGGDVAAGGAMAGDVAAGGLKMFPLSVPLRN
jgi:hypothetical protein